MAKIKFFQKFFKSKPAEKLKDSKSEEDLTGNSSINSNNSKDPNEHLACSCCLEIFTDPLTLLCGHSFCQLCLANWVIASNNKTCPTCRQFWNGVPKINIALKTTVTNLVAERENFFTTEELEERSREAARKRNSSSTQEKEIILRTFERICAQPTLQSNINHSRDVPANRFNPFFSNLFDEIIQNIRIKLFVMVLIVGTLILIALKNITLFSKAQYPLNMKEYRTNLFSKPYRSWSKYETRDWLSNIGPWSNHISNVFFKLNLDGSHLDMLTADILKEAPYNLDNELLAGILIDLIKNLQKNREENIDFWKFKYINRFQVIFFGTFFLFSPRLSMISIYFGQYEEILIPIAKILNKPLAYKVPGLTFFPYFFFRDLVNLNFSDLNRFTCFIIDMNCIVLTSLDLLIMIKIVRIIINYPREQRESFKRLILHNWMKRLVLICFVYKLWNFIPSIFLDMLFLYLVYIDVFVNIYSLNNFFQNFYL